MLNAESLLNKIICGDAAEVMAGWPNECIDLTVTSPPYDPVEPDDDGNLITYPRQGLRDYEGYTWDFVSIARQLWRVTKRGGVLVWVVGDITVNGSETCTPDHQKLYFRKLGFKVHDTMIYGKENFIPLSHNRYEPQFEFMFIFSKGAPSVFNPIKVMSKFSGKTIKRSRKVYDNHSRRPETDGRTNKQKTRGNIWIYKVGGHGTKTFPAAMPEALAHDHIISWSNPGDLVADPFIGSGTTAKMAYLLERNYVGIDISPTYCEIAQRRVAAAVMPILEKIKTPKQSAFEF